MLRRGRLAGITSGDIINHVIEVELPRYTIAPLHREEHYKEYWECVTIQARSQEVAGRFQLEVSQIGL